MTEIFCTACGRPAAVRMQVISNGVRREIALCEQHAAELQARAGVGGFQPGPFGQGAQQPQAQDEQSSSKTPALDEFGRDLTDDARAGRIDPVIGRDAEIEQTVEILARRRKNNAV
ncbi:MAG TPA: ATP-dependent Clp protease ATP-binding subunit, partial [Solirubrobacteraceae bacterium]|nr:ATP-dependent Clp protease ATP-binding subunit [Solirubrobacteraceae bacterium]